MKILYYILLYVKTLYYIVIYILKTINNEQTD